LPFLAREDGITLATALAIEPATLATTPFFLEERFFAFGLDFDLDVRAFGAVLDFDFFVAITDTPTASSFR
jgi:hypothetical protein